MPISNGFSTMPPTLIVHGRTSSFCASRQMLLSVPNS